mmetsp:Transcript_28746/g.35592  ORF Transcript_28746/g.35592 Transcript_28746/m.35592 type:complete len:123 (-) Transcript_28746:439-807(-)
MLHRMHEGVLIISKGDQGSQSESSIKTKKSENEHSYSKKVMTDARELLFSNTPADKLVNTVLGLGMGSKAEKKLQSNELLNRKGFCKVDLSSDMLRENASFDESSQMCTLINIIERQEDKPR